ncbi:MAG: hypothetical protein Q7K57_40170 [Burkholderiaceae bacterium]|nr:hypothetical protein [Burkholderiaceae bacterium]
MPKVAQSKSELLSHLNEQLQFIIRSCDEYDRGTTSEAKRIAASIRVLLHDTKSSASLFHQLNLKSIGFINTALLDIPKSKTVFLGLIQTKITINDNFIPTGKHHPLLNFRPSGWPLPKKRFFPEWWNQIVLTDTRGSCFTRRMLVMAVTNTDGGAHIDPVLDNDYAELSRKNSIGFSVGLNQDITVIDKSELSSIRQIAHELLSSLFDRYPNLLPKDVPYDFLMKQRSK